MKCGMTLPSIVSMTTSIISLSLRILDHEALPLTRSPTLKYNRKNVDYCRKLTSILLTYPTINPFSRCLKCERNHAWIYRQRNVVRTLMDHFLKHARFYFWTFAMLSKLQIAISEFRIISSIAILVEKG